MEEDKTLTETMAIMAEKHHFQASEDQYKKQFSKWKWSKYISANAAGWMLWKADLRKREQGKDTNFEYRGKVLTVTNIQSRVERRGTGGNPQGPTDAGTPSDVTYMTPRNPVSSPLETQSASVKSAQSTWRPLVNSNRGQPQIRLQWNSRTKADYQAQYEEGLGDERCGRLNEAEIKFRSALDGLIHLLSATHPETVTIAYKLASLFAERIRMPDADAVLDWLTQAILEDFGLHHTRTLNHIVTTCEMLRNWDRPGDSVDFLQRYLHELDKERPQPNSTQLLVPSPSRTTLSTTVEHPAAAGEQEQASNFSIPSEGPMEPSLLQTQIRRATSGGHNGGDAEAILLRLIRHCEQFPDTLLAQSLLCYPALFDHYEHVGDVVEKMDAMRRAEQATIKILRSENERTKEELVACLQLAKYLVKGSRDESADDIFSQIECEAQETFGSDHLTTIWFLENIGTFYQNEGRWEDAAPRFEHALAARLSRYGESHESVRRLEDALENGHFEHYVPSKEDEIPSYGESQRMICRTPPPEIILLAPRLRGNR